MRREKRKDGICAGLWKRFAGIMDHVSLRRKLILIYICAIFIPVAVFGSFYLYRTRKIVREQSIQQLVGEVRQSQLELKAMCFSVEEVASMLAYDKELNNKISRTYDTLADARGVYQDLWDQYVNLKGNWPYIRNVTIYFENDQLRTSWPYFVKLTDYMEEKPEYGLIRALLAKGYWSGVRTVPQNREYWYDATETSTRERDQSLAYSRMMGYGTTPYAGQMVVIEIYRDAVEKLLPETSPGERALLLDAKGDSLLDDEERQLSEVLPGYEKLGEQKEETSLWVSEGEARIAAYARLDNGWYLVKSLPLETAMTPWWEMVVAGASFLAGATVVSLLLILLFSITFSNRVTRMVARMEHMMDGSFAIEPPIGGTDEIGRADAQFTVLAENLANTVNEQYIMKLQEEKARLEVLQTQVNPHFLYNALSTIGWLTEREDSQTARRAVEALAKFYQINLSKGQDVIALDQELECLDAYLEIQKLRYAGRVHIYYDLDGALGNVKIPKLTLQALTENCIQHGMAGERESISIAVTSRLEGDRAKITVQDDGLGMSREQLEALQKQEVKSARGNGIGYANVYRRIQLHFGEQYGLQVNSEQGQGTRVDVYLPLP